MVSASSAKSKLENIKCGTVLQEEEFHKHEYYLEMWGNSTKDFGFARQKVWPIRLSLHAIILPALLMITVLLDSVIIISAKRTY